MIKFKPIKPNMSKVEKEAFDAYAKQIIEKLKVSEKLTDLVCKNHQQRPEVIVTGTLTAPELTIKGCCKEIEKEAKKALGL